MKKCILERILQSRRRYYIKCSYERLKSYRYSRFKAYGNRTYKSESDVDYKKIKKKV